MNVLLTQKADSYAQFITVLVIFVLVLGITAMTTKWIANYQKQQSANVNIQVVETTRIATNKYIQIVRIGETYKAIAVCRDTVTLLGDIPAEQLREENSYQGFGFRDFLDKALKKKEAETQNTKESHSDDEV
ncbi:MAG: flagellar biosynthetic protein FliO [Acetatifactor sp.]